MAPYYELFAILVILCGLGSFLIQRDSNKPSSSDTAHLVDENNTSQPLDALGHTPSRAIAFRSFQINYLIVYLCNMMSDWLQGPYIYALYESYGYDLTDIAMLFVAGFLSSAVFGTYVGSFADAWKKFCLAFSVLYILSCLTKLSRQFWVLMVGRLLGGVSTSLLFSVFEAWMVSEHTSRSFSSAALSSTFQWSTYGNGLVAILAGVLANASADRFGLVAPFMLAIVFLLLGAGIVSVTWKENFGSQNVAQQQEKGTALQDGWQVVRQDPRIFAIGMTQSLFESAMYSFVFMWSPALKQASFAGFEVPYGIVFAGFMVSIMIGSLLFRWLTQQQQWKGEQVMQQMLYLAAGSLLVVAFFTASDTVILLSFNVFEVACGMYFPAMGILRSKYIPEETRATVMNLFRIPLNLIVVAVLLKVKYMETTTVFLICTGLVFIGQYMLTRAMRYSPLSPARKAETDPVPVGGH